MEEEVIEQTGSATDTLGNIPMIESEEELIALTKGNGVPATGEKPAAAAAATKKEVKPATPAAVGKKKLDPTVIGDPIPELGVDDEEEEEGNEGKKKKEGEQEEEEEGKKFSDYPTVVHYLNEKHGLQLNLDEEEIKTPERQAEIMDEVVTRMIQGVNDAVKEYDYIETLMTDPEIQAVLKAKSEGKGLKDLFTQFAGTPVTLGDDDLAIKDFKAKYPKATEEHVRGMVDSLKKNGQFDTFVKSLREQLTEEQSFSEAKTKSDAEKQKVASAEQERQEVAEYTSYVSALTNVHGVPVTPEMKKAVVDMTTRRNQKGETYLDVALQSNEGLTLAALGIAFMKDMITNSASLHGNRKNAKFIEKVFKTPDKLQSSGGSGGQKNEDEDLVLLNNF